MKGILFKSDLIAAIDSGQKTQTRRVIPGIGKVSDEDMEDSQIQHFLIATQAEYERGEVIYIKEGFRFDAEFDELPPSKVKTSPIEFKSGGTVNCIGDTLGDPGKWRSKLHLPASFARKFIKITNVRIEKLNNVSEDDCEKEGVQMIFSRFPAYRDYLNRKSKNQFGGFSYWVFSKAYDSFQTLWISLYGEKSWDSNPWVFAYTFVKCDKDGKELQS